MSLLSNIAAIAGSILIPNSVGWLGAISTRKEVTGSWYQNLSKSSLTPPNWVFPVAWTSLYTIIGVASYLVYSNGNGFSGPAKVPLALYGTQLALNGIWSPLFFVAHRPDLSLLDILAMDAFVAATIYSFAEVNKTAALMLLPYMAWISFATYLNFSVWRNNPKKTVD